MAQAESEMPARVAASLNCAMWGGARRTLRCSSLRAAAGFRRSMRSVADMGTNIFRQAATRKAGIAPTPGLALFSPRQTRVARAIVSGFDTIAIGGAFEVDLSYQGGDSAEGRQVASAPFFGSLVVVKADLDCKVTDYSGWIRLRGKGDALISVACDGPSRVPFGESVWFVARPRQTFRPTNLAIAHRPEDWAIEDLRVDGKTQLVPGGGEIPGICFHPDGMDVFMRLDVVPVDKPLAIRARYVGSNPRGGRFGVIMDGVTSPVLATPE